MAHGVGRFVVADGLLTVVIWVPNRQVSDANAPMGTSHSWLPGDARTISLDLAALAGVVMAAARSRFAAALHDHVPREFRRLPV